MDDPRTSYNEMFGLVNRLRDGPRRIQDQV